MPYLFALLLVVLVGLMVHELWGRRRTTASRTTVSRWVARANRTTRTTRASLRSARLVMLSGPAALRYGFAARLVAYKRHDRTHALGVAPTSSTSRRQAQSSFVAARRTRVK